ncbi:hypothetical protein Pcinc_031890 [Petrolisthes cinctipes]|uniref:PiggyBac transposable element-derived protein domain-containing protein n=1 Tax=Petrolisthes cinctipes TaxID=88211 RepID=A0AAE1K467_PETCI|nr:hypothetical protein Pcinc_031890 [Petrolisthes cinctipes]
MPDDDELANLLDDPDEPGPRSSNRCQEQTPEPSHAGQRPTPEPSHAGQEPTPGPSHAGQEPTPGPSHAGQEPTPGQEQRKLTQPRNRRMIPLWRQMGATNSALDPPEWLGNIEPATTVRNPVEYFRDFFTPDIMHNIVSQSNLYATQKDVTRSLNLSVPDFEQFMGSLFAMSLVKLSSSRLYWKAKLQCPMISENMSRDRWEEIKANVHFNDNSTLPNNNSDKLFKVRPLLTHLAAKFRAIPKPQRLCVDEQMVPFKGISSLKQYLPSKPHKWGYKIFCLCGADGIMYDFEVYTGKILPVPGEPDLGASSNVVLDLVKSVPTGIYHLLYFDNWFTSKPLMTTLAKKQILCLGTVRVNRLPGLSFGSDKDLLKTGRGTHQEKSALVDDVEVRAVKWMDNRSVNLLSTFASVEPKGECKRYDKKKKSTVMIPCPAIVLEYNKFMGGVDLMDSLLSLYRIHTRSKKYYHKLLFHFLDVTVVNCWLLYRRDCKDLGIPSRKIMMLQEFKLSLAEALLLEGKSVLVRKRGRPSSAGSIAAEFQRKKREFPATKAIPGDEIRTDGYHHYPVVMVRGRCKNPNCKSVPVFFCNKCKVHLCITKDKNCFLEFHTK